MTIGRNMEIRSAFRQEQTLGASSGKYLLAIDPELASRALLGFSPDEYVKSSHLLHQAERWDFSREAGSDHDFCLA